MTASVIASHINAVATKAIFMDCSFRTDLQARKMADNFQASGQNHQELAGMSVLESLAEQQYSPLYCSTQHPDQDCSYHPSSEWHQGAAETSRQVPDTVCWPVPSPQLTFLADNCPTMVSLQDMAETLVLAIVAVQPDWLACRPMRLRA